MASATRIIALNGLETAARLCAVLRTPQGHQRTRICPRSFPPVKTPQLALPPAHNFSSRLPCMFVSVLSSGLTLQKESICYRKHAQHNLHLY